ncbi:unnamed protein product [Caenorhabditis sp. 36 PRJEB53466]|nr:unnamed protein product [Caenorhabditis sp. 36 PRJEB53466]
MAGEGAARPPRSTRRDQNGVNMNGRPANQNGSTARRSRQRNPTPERTLSNTPENVEQDPYISVHDQLIANWSNLLQQHQTAWNQQLYNSLISASLGSGPMQPNVSSSGAMPNFPPPFLMPQMFRDISQAAEQHHGTVPTHQRQPSSHSNSAPSGQSGDLTFIECRVMPVMIPVVTHISVMLPVPVASRPATLEMLRQHVNATASRHFMPANFPQSGRQAVRRVRPTSAPIL